MICPVCREERPLSYVPPSSMVCACGAVVLPDMRDVYSRDADVAVRSPPDDALGGAELAEHLKELEGRS